MPLAVSVLSLFAIEDMGGMFDGEGLNAWGTEG